MICDVETFTQSPPGDFKCNSTVVAIGYCINGRVVPPYLDYVKCYCDIVTLISIFYFYYY